MRETSIVTNIPFVPGTKRVLYLLQAVCALCFIMVSTGPSYGKSVQNVEVTLQPLVGIPYRNDGARDLQGRYTLFADEAQTFSSPGYNCSGFLLDAVRALLGTKTTIGEAKADRLGNSGPDAPHGEDWDFGWDFILNISEKQKRTLIVPGGKTADPAQYDGFSVPHYPLHAQATWDELGQRLKKGSLYLVSFSRKVNKEKYTLMHYHVGLLVRNAKGDILLYQTTHQSKKSYVRNLSEKNGLAQFMKAFTSKSGPIQLSIIEVTPQ